MSANTSRASVKVQVVLDVEVGDAWDQDCTIGQARSQGIASAEGIVRRALEGGESERKRVRIIGIKSVDLVIRTEP